MKKKLWLKPQKWYFNNTSQLKEFLTQTSTSETWILFFVRIKLQITDAYSSKTNHKNPNKWISVWHILEFSSSGNPQLRISKFANYPQLRHMIEERSPVLAIHLVIDNIFETNKFTV